MDPNETLRQLRALVRQCQDGGLHAEPGEGWVGQVREALDLFTDLDGWLSRGGFPPTAWTPQPPTPGPDTARVFDQVTPPNPGPVAAPTRSPCGCECSTGGWCGGCGHAGCARR